MVKGINTVSKTNNRQKLLFDKTDKWKEEWVGMPEFVQEKKEPYCTLIVRFRNENDLNEFARIIGQKLTAKSQSTWYPELERSYAILKRYVDDES